MDDAIRETFLLSRLPLVVPERLRQIFDSCAAVFDVSPLAMDRGSRPGRWHSATFHAFLSGLPN
jgi:hypothetical protein